MKKQLRTEIKQRRNAAKILNNHDYILYNLLLEERIDADFIKKIGNSLISHESHEYKHYAADVLSQIGNAKVLPYLIKAVRSDVNKGFSAPYIWACSAYNCASYIDFFVDLIIKCEEPNENVLACISVFMSLGNPDRLEVFKKAIIKLLRKKNYDAFMEMLIAQAISIISEKYFTYADENFKNN